MVYDELSNLEIFLCCQGAEQVNSGQLAPRALRKAIGDDRTSGCEEGKSKIDGDQTVSLGSYNTFRSSQSGDDSSPWSMHHFRLLLADMIIHDFYSFDDS